jgi:plastocyanin
MRKLTLPLLLAASLLIPVLTMATGDNVAITDVGFTPQVVTVPLHSVVTWTNTSAAVHTVTADGYEFGSGALQVGDVFTQTFHAHGVFPYHDMFSAFTGEVRVRSGVYHVFFPLVCK